MSAYRKLGRKAPALISTLLLTGVVACGGNTGNDSNNGGGAAGSVAGGADSAMGRNTSGAGAGSGSGDMPLTASRLTDTTALLLIASVHRAEASSGKLAGTKARNSEVKAYARMIVLEHRADMTRIRRLVTSAQLPASIGMDSVTQANAGMGAAGGIGSAGTPGGGAAAGNTNATGTGGTAGTGTAGMGATSAVTSSDATIRNLEQMQAQTMSQLQSATGAEFDKAYINSQIAAHTQVLDVLRQNESQLSNAGVKAHVAALTQSIEKHLQRAKEIHQKLGGGDSTSAAMSPSQPH